MPADDDLDDKELTLFKENYEEINIIELKIFEFQRYSGLDFDEQIDQAEEEILEIKARTTMQNCMQKIESFGNSSRAVDAFVRISLDLIEMEIKHCRDVPLQVAEEESIKREMENLEARKIKTELVLNDANHPERKEYYFQMVKNIASTMPMVLDYCPVHDEQLKIALCIFEIQYRKVDIINIEIVLLKLSKERELHESIAYKNIVDEISDLELKREIQRESLQFRSSLRRVQRLTSGNCTQAVDIRLIMLILHKEFCMDLVKDEIRELPLITDLSVNKYELLNAHEHLCLKLGHEIVQLEDMLDDNERRIVFNNEMFKDVTKLNDEEIERLDKVLYNEEIHSLICPICLDEHTDGELLVSLRCPCKKERLCQSCAFKALKEKSQCPCCRAHV